MMRPLLVCMAAVVVGAFAAAPAHAGIAIQSSGGPWLVGETGGGQSDAMSLVYDGQSRLTFNSNSLATAEDITNAPGCVKGNFFVTCIEAHPAQMAVTLGGGGNSFDATGMEFPLIFFATPGFDTYTGGPRATISKVVGATTSWTEAPATTPSSTTTARR